LNPRHVLSKLPQEPGEKDWHNLYPHQHHVRHRHHGIPRMYIGECDKPSFFSTHQQRCHALNFLILLTLCSDLQFREIQIFNLSEIPLGSGKRHKGCRQNQIVESLVLIWALFWMGRSWQSYIESGGSVHKRLQGRLRRNHPPLKVRNLGFNLLVLLL